MVWMVVVTMPPLPTSGGGSLFHTSLILHLLVYSSREQFKQELTSVAYNLIACHASQSVMITEYIYFARKYMTDDLT